MSDYSNSYGGATKDSSNSIIYGADLDTQFDAIESMSGTKANKVSGATNGNLATIDSNGDLVDSGSSVSTITTLINDGDALPTEESGHVRAGDVQIIDGASLSNTFSLTSSITEAVYETVGPTGSGADNVWTEMDALPAEAKIMIVRAELAVQAGSATLANTLLYSQSADTSAAIGNQQIAARCSTNNNDTVYNTSMVFLPLNSSLHTKLAWRMTNLYGGSGIIYLTYAGFITD